METGTGTCMPDRRLKTYLYVHYPTDVLGGVILGILSGYAGYRIIAYIAKQKQRKNHAEDQRIN